MKVSLMLATATLLLGTLGACGGSSSTDDYCAEVKNSKSLISGSAAPAEIDWEGSFTTLHALADSAPDDIATTWETFERAITEIEADMKDAGLEASDLSEVGKTSNGSDPKDVANVLRLLEPLASDKVSKAWDAVVKHAKDECKVDLSDS